MPVSMKCEECLKVKRCHMYVDDHGKPTYLCRPCARLLGWVVKVGSVWAAAS